MIVVTGTMRSGTSMWMQILIAAGLPHLGDAFPLEWGERLRPFNPRGFFESQLVAGVYHATNPHPESGDYLFPAQTQRHVVKVFVPGLVRSDVAFLDRVIGTVRGFREVCASRERMGAVTGARWEEAGWLHWWALNFALVRDIAVRRYPSHVTTYGRLLRDPEREIKTVLAWLGGGNLRAAVDAVAPSLRNLSGPLPTPPGLSRAHAAVFDALHEHLDLGRDLSPAFVDQLNRTDTELRPLLLAHGPSEGPTDPASLESR